MCQIYADGPGRPPRRTRIVPPLRAISGGSGETGGAVARGVGGGADGRVNDQQPPVGSRQEHQASGVDGTLPADWLGRFGARSTLAEQTNLFNEVTSVFFWKLKNERVLITQSIE